MIEFLDSIPLWFILSSVALFAGFVDAIAGGGGLLTVPALLSTGMPVHMVLGTNKLASSFGTATASYTFYKNKLFSPKLWIHCAVSTFIGALLGAFAVYLVSGEFLEKILPILIIATAVYTLFKKSPPSTTCLKKSKPCRLKQWLQGLTIGFYDGFAGPGAGAFWTVSGQILYKIDILLSSGVARAMNFISNFTALITFVILGQVDYLIGVTMGVCLMIGSVIGAKAAIRFGSSFIRPIFIFVVLCISAKLAWSAWL
ncbi:sulfite exporter TauE/SafE family protein [Psychrobium sp. nBUS_13]|uniref:sulfite exporter TauE/SafE family protein n=1 Tax=Psychrobium sp. nBUS_13 TaxID=3395319 RepID=UPI003EBC53E6